MRTDHLRLFEWSRTFVYVFLTRLQFCLYIYIYLYPLLQPLASPLPSTTTIRVYNNITDNWHHHFPLQQVRVYNNITDNGSHNGRRLTLMDSEGLEMRPKTRQTTCLGQRWVCFFLLILLI